MIPQSPGPKPGAIPISLLLDDKREPTSGGLEPAVSRLASGVLPVIRSGKLSLRIHEKCFLPGSLL